MVTHIDALHLRKAWGRGLWLPPEPWGPDGWSMTSRDGISSIIVTVSDWDGVDWVHASIAHRAHTPTYAELVKLHTSVWKGRGYAHQVFAPASNHVNIHEYALHLWGRLDGARVLPDFGVLRSI